MSRGITQSPIRYWRTMPRRGRAGALLLTACLLALTIVTWATKSRVAYAQSDDSGPDYSQVTNFTNGNQHLLRSDDLNLTLGGPWGAGENTLRPYDQQFLFSITTGHSATDYTFTGTGLYDNTITPGGKGNCGGNGPCGVKPRTSALNTPSTIGRFFRTGQDSLIKFDTQWTSDTGPVAYKIVTLTGRKAGDSATYTYASEQPSPINLTPTTVVKTAVADFNGDGFDDVLFAYSDYSADIANNARVVVATAVNLDDPSQGFRFGPEQILGYGEGIRAVAAGDFNGDGKPEFATLRVEGGDLDLQLATFTVNPQDFTTGWTGQQVTVDVMKDGANRPMELQALTMTNSPLNNHKQLALAYTTGLNQPYQVTLYDFEQNSYVFQKVSTENTLVYATDVKMKVGRLNWASPNDEIVLMTTNVNVSKPENSASYVQVIFLNTTTNQLTNSAPGASLVINVGDQMHAGQHKFVALDIAIGNFDNWNAPAGQVPATRNPNLKIAIATAEVSNHNQYGNYTNSFLYPNGHHIYWPTGGIFIWNLGANLDSFTVETEIPLLPIFQSAIQKESGGQCSPVAPSSGPGYEYQCNNRDYWFWRQDFFQAYIRYLGFYSLSLDALDLQGRSLRLGSGYKVAIDRTAPTTVLAAPPMHADYITPNGAAAPTVLNVSVVPDAFKSGYEVEQSNDSSTSSTQKIGSTFSADESVGVTLQFGKMSGGELENGVKISDTASATQDYEKSAETKNGSFQSTEFSISQETGLSDVVWFKESTYYLYSYEVVGQKVCPADKPNCAEGEKVPLRVTFSAPKETTVQRMASDTLEWYQPPWEYGNLFSYPSSLGQLKQYVPDIALLTKENSVYGTDDAGTTLKTTWTNGKTTGQSIAQKETLGWKNDFSLEGKHEVTLLGFGGSASAQLDISTGGSKSTESLQESETKTTSSSGISIIKTGTFADAFSYKYFFSPYIFGQQQPDGFTDPVIATTDLTTFGALRSAFTADPLASGAGGWWKQTYNVYPDIALNHPNRWSYSSNNKPSTGNLPVNCLGIDLQHMNCVAPTEREPENPWLDPFHDMRGFFISDAATPGQGGQLQLATIGEKLSLQTRVYNYSLAAMPAGSKVKANFYAMEWNTSNNRPALDKATSWYIGTGTIDALPGYSNAPNAPLNWALIGTTLDTSGYFSFFANEDVVFWVEVWMEDANGNLLQEPTGKGLTQKPQAGTTVYFETHTDLEQLVDNPLKVSADDPAQVSFSNNIGFYRLPVHFLPKGASASLGATGGTKQVKVESVTTDTAALKPGKAAKVRVALRNGSQAALSLTVYFYDGDPAKGGKLFDAEHLAYLGPEKVHDVSVVYRPQQCGTHQVFVKVTEAGEVIATGSAAQGFQVECPAPICTTQACMKSAQYYARNTSRLPQGIVTIFGRGLQSQVSTQQAALMNSVLQGGPTGLAQLNQQFVTTQLNLLGQGVLNQGTLGSNLLCYGINFQPAQLSTGVSLDPSLTLGQLFDQARRAGSTGNAADMRMIATVLHLLNGDDPSGRCQTGR